QNKQIVDSIKYARYIQKAVLPPEKMIKNFFSEYFIMYRPKDIVSGDFYWTKKEDNRIYFAAADATGHGVPGAFMSMLGLSLMNEISYDFKGNAAEFLNNLRDKIKVALRQSEYDNSPQDGFDVALCIFYPKKGKLDYAGAHNSMLIARNEELIEVKADKMPVGVYFREKESFTNNNINVSENDMIYLFSDGYRDQFGGPKNNKFSMKQFKQTLLDIHLLKVNEQKTKLEQIFDDWKDDKSQIDDVLVTGIKIVAQ
ncbi:MAG: SpoIIE family protein phosphatase, partial [Bacteroidota bacterium]|nr:SpoIIE family protein phosphatase [Bacteroidota bacterium]